MLAIKIQITGGVDADRLRGGLKPRPLEPDPDHAGGGKMMNQSLNFTPLSPPTQVCFGGHPLNA